LPHHESTVSGNTTDLLALEELERSFEGVLDFFVHGVVHANLEGEASDNPEVDIVSVRFGGVNISGCWWVVVVKSDNSERNLSSFTSTVGGNSR
jgi:hypothetical protein